jgi:hypothetical protein
MSPKTYIIDVHALLAPLSLLPPDITTGQVYSVFTHDLIEAAKTHGFTSS